MGNHEIESFYQEQKERFVTRKMVVKIGSSTVIEGGSLFIYDFARQASTLFNSGVKIAIVCSGAVDRGNLLVRNHYNLDTTLDKQTTAFYGQSNLVKEWVSAFEGYKVLAGEFLIAEDHLGKAKELLIQAMDYGVPIINGYDAINDNTASVSSDNDKLAAFVSRSINADTTVFLTDVNGVLDEKDELIPFVDRLENIEEVIVKKGSGTGGMWGKCIEASRLARQGQRSIIANGRTSNLLLRIAKGENLGTRFERGWMLY